MAQAKAAYPRWKLRFFTVWIGQAFSLFGSQLVQFALVWWLTETTRSATVLATATLVAILPQVVLGPIAGPLIDRWNRKHVMIVADSLVALTTLVLAALFAAGTAQIWQVYLAMFIRAAAGGFHQPSMQASTSLMVPDDQLSRVAGLNQMLQGLMSIVAPPVGALLIGVLPMPGVLAVDIGTALVAVLAVLIVPIPQPSRLAAAAGSALATFWRDLRDGLGYIRSWIGLMAVMVFAMLLNFVIVPSISLVALLVTNHFGGGVEELAALNSALGIGVVAGGITLGIWGGFKRRIITSLIGIVGISVGFLLVGIAPPHLFGLAVVGFFIAGFAQPISNGPIFAVLQSVVTPEMQGRVFTLLVSSASLMMPISLSIAGPLADRIGVQTMYLISGGMCLLMTAGAVLFPPLLNIEQNNAVVTSTAAN